MKAAVILFLALAAIVSSKATEVHYHYHGLSPDAVAKHDWFFGKPKPHCTYHKKSSKWNIFAKKQGWNCKNEWDKCVENCDGDVCTWVCSKEVQQKGDKNAKVKASSKTTVKA